MNNSEEENQKQKTLSGDFTPNESNLSENSKHPSLECKQQEEGYENIDTESEDLKILKALMEENGFLGIENLVFEGGGAKGVVYYGVIKVLEKIGMMSKIRRYAGTSVGSMAAGILALGGTAADLKKVIYNTNMKELIYDASFGRLSLIPNMLKKFGWNPAENLLREIKKVIQEVCGNPDITFMELYKTRGVELCIVISNISTMSPEYCHPKTTPDMSIATAIRTSASMPGIMQPIVKGGFATKDYLVDGGLLCNFPIHVFDGWYLSMEKTDTFFHKLITNEPAFGTFNEKTLGVVMFCCTDHRLLREEMKNNRIKKVSRPNTRLARSRAKLCDKVIEMESQRQAIYEAGIRFLQALDEADLNRDGTISMDEYRKAFLEDKVLSEEDSQLLFGKSFDMHGTFDVLDTDHTGNITAVEFLSFMQSKGVSYRAILSNGGMSFPVKDLTGFVMSTFMTVAEWACRVYYQSRDHDRMMALFTDYIQTTDFDMEEADKLYLMQVGEETTVRYLLNRLTK